MAARLGYQPDRQPKTSTHQSSPRQYMPVREVQKIAEEKLRPVNQGLVLTGSAMNFADFVTDIYESDLPTTAFEQHAGFLQRASRLEVPEAGDSRVCLCATLRGSRCSSISREWRTQVSYPTISKIRDMLSSIRPLCG